MKKYKFCLLILLAVLSIISCKKEKDTNTVTDIDGNVYHFITIGNQVWMAENLKVTHYSNGDPIPCIQDSAAWFNSSSGAYCNYNNSEINSVTFGRIYNWYVIGDSRNICPAGWHVPVWQEWNELIDYLGGNSIAGGKLKTAGTECWSSPNTGATNSSGFNGLPGGCRNTSFNGLSYNGWWWSADTSHIEGITNSGCARLQVLNYDNVYTTGYPFFTLYDLGPLTGGFSIRCIKDN